MRPLQPDEPEISRQPIRPDTPREPEPIEPDMTRQPQDVKPITRPSQPEQPEYEPQQPEARPIEPKTTDDVLEPEKHDSEQPEPSPTPPQVVYVEVGKETATIDGQKTVDGSVVVDTHDVPKNEWTTVKERPSVSCPPGFEPNNNGICIGM